MEDIDELEISHDTTPESESSRTEIVGLVRTAIARLPEGQRQVVTLVDLEGFSYVQVSQILDVPIGTVMSRLCRARNAMKTMLLPEMQQNPAMSRGIRRIK
jgi:RNA polymerase sigma-70 factor (ECF subfamily)